MSAALLLPCFALCHANALVISHRLLLRHPPIVLCDATDLVSVIKSVGIGSGDKRIRVTASDLSAATGLDMSSSRQALTQLSAELNGAAMEVSKNGDIVYAIPRNARLHDRQKGVRLISRASTVARSAVGLMLIASLAFVRPLLSRKDAKLVSLR